MSWSIPSTFITINKSTITSLLIILLFSVKGMTQPHTIYGMSQGFSDKFGGELYGEGGVFELRNGAFKTKPFRSEFAHPAFRFVESNGKLYGYSFVVGSDQGAPITDYLWLVEAKDPKSPLLSINTRASFYYNFSRNPEIAISGDTLVFVDQKRSLCSIDLQSYQITTLDSTAEDMQILFEKDKIYYTNSYGSIREYSFLSRCSRLVGNQSFYKVSQPILKHDKLHFFTCRDSITQLVKLDITSGDSSQVDDILKLGPGKPRSPISQIDNWMYFSYRPIRGSNRGSVWRYNFNSDLVERVVDFDTTAYIVTQFGTINFQNKIYGLCVKQGATDSGAVYEFDPSTGGFRFCKEITMNKYNRSISLGVFKGELFVFNTFTDYYKIGNCQRINPENDSTEIYPYRNALHGLSDDKPIYNDGKLLGLNGDQLVSWDISSGIDEELSQLPVYKYSSEQHCQGLTKIGDKIYGLYRESTGSYTFTLYSFDLNTKETSILKTIPSGTYHQGEMFNYNNYLFITLNYYPCRRILRYDLQTGDTISISTAFEEFGLINTPLTLVNGKIALLFSEETFHANKPTLYTLDPNKLLLEKQVEFQSYSTKSMNANLVSYGSKVFSVATGDSTFPNGYLYSYDLDKKDFSILYKFPSDKIVRSEFGTLILADSMIYGITQTSGAPYSKNSSIFSFNVKSTEITHYAIDGLSDLLLRPDYIAVGPPSISSKGGSFALYPNPGNANFTVEFPEEFSGTIEIFDMIGKRIAYQSYIDPVMKIKQDLTDNSAGCYFIRAINLNGQLVGEGRFVNY